MTIYNEVADHLARIHVTRGNGASFDEKNIGDAFMMLLMS